MPIHVNNVYVYQAFFLNNCPGTMLVQTVQEQTTSRSFRKRTRSRGQSVDRCNDVIYYITCNVSHVH